MKAWTWINSRTLISFFVQNWLKNYKFRAILRIVFSWALVLTVFLPQNNWNKFTFVAHFFIRILIENQKSQVTCTFIILYIYLQSPMLRIRIQSGSPLSAKWIMASFSRWWVHTRTSPHQHSCSRGSTSRCSHTQCCSWEDKNTLNYNTIIMYIVL